MGGCVVKKIELGGTVEGLFFSDRFSMSNSNSFKWRHYVRFSQQRIARSDAT